MASGFTRGSPGYALLVELLEETSYDLVADAIQHPDASPPPERTRSTNQSSSTALTRPTITPTKAREFYNPPAFKPSPFKFDDLHANSPGKYTSALHKFGISAPAGMPRASGDPGQSYPNDPRTNRFVELADSPKKIEGLQTKSTVKPGVDDGGNAVDDEGSGTDDGSTTGVDEGAATESASPSPTANKSKKEKEKVAAPQSPQDVHEGTTVDTNPGKHHPKPAHTRAPSPPPPVNSKVNVAKLPTAGHAHAASKATKDISGKPKRGASASR